MTVCLAQQRSQTGEQAGWRARGRGLWTKRNKNRSRRNYSQSEGGAGRAITASPSAGAVSGARSSQRRVARPPLPFLPSLSLRRRQSARQIIYYHYFNKHHHPAVALPHHLLGCPPRKHAKNILLEAFLVSSLPSRRHCPARSPQRLAIPAIRLRDFPPPPHPCRSCRVL